MNRPKLKQKFKQQLDRQSGEKAGSWGQSPGFRVTGRCGSQDFARKLCRHKLVLYFYPKDDTSSCTKEAIDFNGLRDEFKKAGGAILGVSAASHAKFKTKHKLDLALAADESKAMLDAYGVWVGKSMYGRTWGSSARPSSSARTAGSQRFGTR